MDWKELIFSGLLELYALGDATAEQCIMIEEIMVVHNEVRIELNEIELALENYALSHSIEPDPIAKPFLLATLDYMDRMKAGEAFSVAPELQATAIAEDYRQWLDREDMVVPAEIDNIYAKIISHSPALLSAIVWIKEMAPQEVHDHEFEKFLILEGTCDIYVENDVFSLLPGDYFAIPLHKKHHVMVTSNIPCKVILQRVAA